MQSEIQVKSLPQLRLGPACYTWQWGSHGLCVVLGL